jgi:predicted transcriptional regulator
MPPKKPESEKAIRINTSLDPELYERVSRFCNQEERSYAWVVKKALIEYLEKRGL